MLHPDSVRPNYRLDICCTPIPGDDVLGFVNDDEEVVVHKVSCHKANRLKTAYGSRLVKTRWGETADKFIRQQWTLCTGEYSFCDKRTELCQSQNNCLIEVRAGTLAICKNGCHQKIIIRNDAGQNNSGCGKCGSRKEEKLAVYCGTARLYDIRNAGRYHRFTVSGKLVHNCGYGGGAGALISMGALDMGLKEDELPDIITSWREANPNIVKFWYSVEKAAIETIKIGRAHV